MAKKETKDTEVTLEEVLWQCRVALRGVGGTDKNRDAVISLVFIKFVSDKFEKRRKEIIDKYGDNPVFVEKDSFYRSQNVFYLPETSRWNYIVENGSSNKIAVIIDKALNDISERNDPLKGALPTNLFATLGAENRNIKKLIDEINKISKDRFDEEDLIGRVYEYFLQAYAAAGTKDDGEFYTPACVVKLISELIEPYSGTVYDPCCGSGGMFVQSLKFVEAHNGNKSNISVIGQESNLDTWRLCRMNLSVRGIAHDLGVKNASTFTNDLHKDRNHQIDFIMANPPFNLKEWRGKDELLKDDRFNGYAVPPVANANYAWILHMLQKLDVSNGIAGFLLANGALNADGQEEFAVRKNLLENDKIEAIIVLPRNMFYTTDISVTLWIMNNNKKARELNGRSLRDRTNEVLFMDLRTWDDTIETYTIDKRKKTKATVLSDVQIEKVKNIYHGWQTGDYEDVPELCKTASLDDIREENYNLAPSKYVEFIDHDLEIDYEVEMKRIQSKMKNILKVEKESQKKLEEAFRGIGYEID